MSRPEPSREEALRRLDEQANALEARTARPVADHGHRAVGRAYQLLGTLIAGPFVGVALGLFVDGFAGTAPWGIIAGVLLGFGVSVFLAMNSARRMSERAEAETGPARPLPFDDEDEE